MSDSIVRLSVPAKPSFARSVRMMAANLAVLSSLNVDEVEDARMAAEEAFVYACATGISLCEITFTVSDDALDMTFALGSNVPSENDELAEQVSFAELLLSTVSDVYEVASDHSTLRVVKQAGGAHAA